MLSFKGIKIKKCRNVYEPAEDSILLAQSIDVRPGDAVLDMGAGTGLLGLLAAKEAKSVLSVDKSGAAIRCIKENIELNNVTNVSVRESDMFSNIIENFDLIIFNPPYLPTEDKEPKDDVSMAWDGGETGRSVIDRFLEGVEEHLVDGGRLLMLGSSLGNYDLTIKNLEEKGFVVSILSSKKLDFEKLVVIKAVYDF
jgi:release factor glutamine methyltransferase